MGDRRLNAWPGGCFILAIRHHLANVKAAFKVPQSHDAGCDATSIQGGEYDVNSIQDDG